VVRQAGREQLRRRRRDDIVPNNRSDEQRKQDEPREMVKDPNDGHEQRHPKEPTDITTPGEIVIHPVFVL
jgi:hypothetical protein